MKKQWTLPELAEEATRRGKSVSREYIRQQCVEGKLKASKPGRDWLVNDRDAQEWLERWLTEG